MPKGKAKKNNKEVEAARLEAERQAAEALRIEQEKKYGLRRMVAGDDNYITQ